MPFLSRLRAGAAKRAEYRRTLAELRSMPAEIALNVDFAPGDAEAIARKAVYGH